MGKRRGTAKQHSMDVDSTKAAATDGWDYGGGATLGGGDDMTDGAAGAGEVAPPRTAPSVSLGGDGSAKMGLFGLVTGGGAKKRKVQMTFKQKRRKIGKIAKAVARGERETTKRHSAGSRRESKNTLKKLW